MNQLARRIGLTALVLFGIGDILGAGIYGLIGKAAGQMGNAIWAAFATSMVAAGLTGLCYASLGSRYPRAAGAAYIIQKAFRKPAVSYSIGLAVMCSGLTSMATSSRVFAGYLNGFFPGLPIEAAIILFTSALALIVFIGIRESMFANAICTLVELSGLALILIFGFSFIGSVDYTALPAGTAVHTGGQWGVTLLFSGAVLTFYSFIGFEDMLNVSEEVKNPQRNLPLGLLLAVGISSVIYILISLISVAAVPAVDLANSNQPLVDVAAKVAPWFPPGLFRLISLFAVANTALLNFVMGSRLMFGMSRDGLLPQALSKVHKSRQTPHIAILSIWVILLVLAFTGDVSSLAKATSLLLLVSFCVTNIALFVLQGRKEEPRGSFEIPRFIPILGTLICVIMIGFGQKEEWAIAGVILVIIWVMAKWLKPRATVVEKIGS